MTIDEMERLYAEAGIDAAEVYDENEGGETPPRPLWCVANEAYRRNEIMLDPEPLPGGFQVAVSFGCKAHADLIAAALNNFPALLAVVKAAKARSDFYRNEAEHLTEDELLAEEIDRDIALEEALLPFAERQG